ncbi:PEP-CTERM sorting domain-containing protein [Cerasicoccus maritimus]|uniref:PEP-CTERM sorting domain-containing protein n=1 Tax=Cerasicoccus maritimus TaxID=490089 RepID=UPI002852C414|nr:PEP-CTERM sorting domain-containing protein [Cerasicoccus maritimus]
MKLLRYLAPLILAANLNGMMLFTLQETPTDVIFTATGSIDSLTGLTHVSDNPGAGLSGIRGLDAVFAVGTSGTGYSVYSGVSGPISLGTGGLIFSNDSASGSIVGIQGANTFLILPVGYITTTPLNSTFTFTGYSLATLGVNSGTYEWNWGGGSGDSATLNVIPVPEPSVYIALAGFAGLGLLVWRRRSRAYQSAA